MTHAGKTAVWYCDGCTNERQAGDRACSECCGFKVAEAPADSEADR